MWTTKDWPTREIVIIQQSLTTLEKVVQDLPHSTSDAINGSLARFLVVRICGTIEQIIEQCCKSYLLSKSDFRSSSFGHSFFGRGANPKPTALITLVRKFDPLWAEELEQLFLDDDELLHREIEFLVDRRNKIAHGLNEGIGVRKALDLVRPAEILTNWFIERFDPR